MVKNKILAWLLAASLILGVVPVFSAANEDADESGTAVSDCLFGDDFESYANTGEAIYAKLWDSVVQDEENGGRITVDTNDGNGFAAFSVKPKMKDNKVTTPVTALKKNGIDNAGRTLMYDGRFYTFGEDAKMSLLLTDVQDTQNIELVTLKGAELNARSENLMLTKASDSVPLRTWNRISVAVDGAKGEMKVYLNNVLLRDSIRFRTENINLSKLSFKIMVKNNFMDAYTDGRIYMDDFYIYEAEKPAALDALTPNGTIITYLNKQFTSIATNGRAHGISGFTTGVSIVDFPSELDKSAEIGIGSENAYIPLDETADESVIIKLQYQSDKEIALMAKNKNGKQQKIVNLPKHTELSDEIVMVDMKKKTAALRGKDSKFGLSDIAYLGFSGNGNTIILHHIFAYSGSRVLEDSYFKDYSYQQKAIKALVTDAWKSSYNTISKGVFMGIDFYQASVFGKNLRFEGQPPRVFNEKPYVPAESAAVFLGGELLESSEGIALQVNGKKVKIPEDEIYIAKKTRYVTAEYMAELFGLQLSWDGEYLLGFGKAVFFSKGNDNENLKSAMYYQRPSGEEVFDRIEKRGGVQPRVWADGERIAEIKKNIEKYPTIKVWSDKLIADAEKKINEKKLIYEKPDGIRLLSVSQELLTRMSSLGFAYQMTGDKRYAQAAWRDLEAVSGFGDWNPSHWLDIATMSMGVAIGYSWFYDCFTDEQKDIIVRGFERCGLNAYINAVDSRDWWTFVNSNWNPWCHGGVLQAIIAMSDRLGDNAKYALDRLFPYVEYLYPEFVPDGAWKEGLSYHAATLYYLSMWCETLETATGIDYGYWDLPGMDVTAYYGEALSGKGGSFNYGDDTTVIANYQAQEWFAKKYKDPGLAQMRYDHIVENGFATMLYDVVMTRPEIFGESEDMERDMLYKNMRVVSMRTSWTDSTNGIFLAAKGGENGVSHFHYDLGGFVMDVGGVRFAYELGREGYAITQRDTKTHQYKKRAEGHNTYVINPTEDPGQSDSGIANVLRFETKEKGGLAVIDLANAYGARKMQRGFMLTDDRQTMIIQDEVLLPSKSEVYWFMHTQGDIREANDGKTVYITKDGVTIRMDILDSNNENAKFSVMDPLPLPSTPWLEGQGRNEKFKKLAIHWNNVQSFTVAVAVRQVLAEELDLDYREPVKPIAQWSIPDGKLEEKPKINAITKDGKLIEGFNPEKTSYVVQLPYDTEIKPDYQVEAGENQEITKIDCDGVVGITKFIVKDTINNKFSCYSVTTKIGTYIGVIPGVKEAEIERVTAEKEPEYEAGNRAVCVLDGDYITRWTAEDDAWITLELKEAVDVYALGVAWYMGDSRTYIYDIEISEDGENWTQVFSGTSSGITTKLECSLLGNKRAKYVRYQGHGHTAGNWNNITEMRVYKK